MWEMSSFIYFSFICISCSSQCCKLPHHKHFQLQQLFYSTDLNYVIKEASSFLFAKCSKQCIIYLIILLSWKKRSYHHKWEHYLSIICTCHLLFLYCFSCLLFSQICTQFHIITKLLFSLTYFQLFFSLSLPPYTSSSCLQSTAHDFFFVPYIQDKFYRLKN